MADAKAVILTQLDKINPAAAPRNCTVTIRNSTTPEREAVIVAAGVHFFYSDKDGNDEGDYLAGPVRVELAAGAAAPFKSSDPRRNVTKLVVGVKVRFGDQEAPTTKTFNFTKQVDAPVFTSLPPRRTFIINEDVALRVADVANFSVTDASQWFELVIRSGGE